MLSWTRRGHNWECQGWLITAVRCKREGMWLVTLWQHADGLPYRLYKYERQHGLDPNIAWAQELAEVASQSNANEEEA